MSDKEPTVEEFLAERIHMEQHAAWPFSTCILAEGRPYCEDALTNARWFLKTLTDGLLGPHSWSLRPNDVEGDS